MLLLLKLNAKSGCDKTDTNLLSLGKYCICQFITKLFDFGILLQVAPYLF